jgi:hypothetical protein
VESARRRARQAPREARASGSATPPGLENLPPRSQRRAHAARRCEQINKGARLPPANPRATPTAEAAIRFMARELAARARYREPSGRGDVERPDRVSALVAGRIQQKRVGNTVSGRVDHPLRQLSLLLRQRARELRELEGYDWRRRGAARDTHKRTQAQHRRDDEMQRSRSVGNGGYESKRVCTRHGTRVENGGTHLSRLQSSRAPQQTSPLEWRARCRQSPRW